MSWSHLSTADVVALLAVRAELSARDPATIHRVSQVRLEDLRVWEGQAVLTLIHDRLQEADLIKHLPTVVQDQMRAITAEYARISDLYTCQAGDVIAGLREDGITAVLLKDPRGFARAELRPAYDLDLLVPAHQLSDCAVSLRRQGFQPRLGPLQERLLGRESSWSRQVGSTRISIDLHWHILDSYRPRRDQIDLQALFDEASPVPVNGLMLPVLSLEHHLLLVCLHACEHELRFPSRLVTWLDISETIRTFETTLDWDRFVTLTHDFGATNEVYTGLRVAETLLAVKVPAHILAAVRPRFATLGIEQSCFGYWNYLIKYLDDVHRCQARPHPGLPLAEQALRDAQTVWRHCQGLGDALVAAGVDVVTFGESAQMLVPDPRFRAVGDIDFLVHGLPRVAIEQILRRYVTSTQTHPAEATSCDGPCDAPEPAREATPRYLLSEAGLSIWVEFPAVPVYGHHVARSVSWLIQTLFWRVPSRPGRRGCTVRVIVTEEGQTARFLLNRLADRDATELAALVALGDWWDGADTAGHERVLAEATGAREFAVLELATQDAAGIPARCAGELPWTFLSGLDNRSRDLETLTKFLVHPSGVRVVALLSGHGLSRALRIAREVIRRPARSYRDLRYVLRELRAPAGQRVPPRLYLTAHGETLTSLRG